MLCEDTSFDHIIRRGINKISMDPYDILGINALDSFQTIRSAYLKKARLCHPDKTGSTSSSEFLRIQQAWTMIKMRIDSPGSFLKSVNAGSVSFADLEPRDEFLVYPCRCGDVYEVSNLGQGYFIID